VADIAPVVPSIQLAPAGPAAATAPVAAVAPIAPGTAQDFIAQLSSALKSLKGLAGVVTAVAPQPTTPTDQPVAPAPEKDHTEPTAPTAAPDDIMELLATLGLVPAPTLTINPGQPSTPATSSSALTGSMAPTVSIPTASTPPTVPTSATPSTPSTPAPPASSDTVLDVAPNSTNVTPPTVVGDPTTLTPPIGSTNHVATPPATTTEHAPPPAQPAAPAQLPVDNVPLPTQPAQPITTGPAVHVVPQPVSTTLQTGFQQNTDSGDGHAQGDGQQHTTQSSAPIAAAPGTDVLPTPERVFTVAAPVVAPSNAAQLPENVHPAQIATQIAQQVDLYRLPGNKGVRIQLHPEDLGGVQVTLRYVSGGNLELHISVEHAATGALVQAGMPQLRDALVSQGFSPDRMVMSVSASAAAGQMDFSSNNNGSNRSDTSGMAAFTQNGQSNPQRDDERRDGPTPPGWSSGADPSTSTSTSTTDNTSSVTGSNSRIDYRV